MRQSDADLHPLLRSEDDIDPESLVQKGFVDELKYQVRDHYNFACNHFKIELELFRNNWKLLLFAAIFQYIHKIATNIAYYLHTPDTPLRDLGFELLPALSKRMQIISEIAFFLLFGYTIFFFFTPFIKSLNQNHNPKRKPLYTVTMLSRFSAVLIMAQALRCICFLVTSLPGPNYHCRPGSPDYNPPTTIHEMLTRLDAFFGCGDLVFSSHTIFIMMCALTLHKYQSYWSNTKKIFMWIWVVFFACLVIAARKHYTLDIVIALYTVPLLWIAYDKHYPDILPDNLDTLYAYQFEKARTMNTVE